MIHGAGFCQDGPAKSPKRKFHLPVPLPPFFRGILVSFTGFLVMALQQMMRLMRQSWGYFLFEKSKVLVDGSKLLGGILFWKRFTRSKTNMASWKIHQLKMYSLLKMGIFQCHVCFQGGYSLLSHHWSRVTIIIYRYLSLCKWNCWCKKSLKQLILVDFLSMIEGFYIYIYIQLYTYQLIILSGEKPPIFVRFHHKQVRTLLIEA